MNGEGGLSEDGLSDVLGGRRVILRPVEPTDYTFLYRQEVELEYSGLWRGTGRTPSPEKVVTDLWAGVLAQFVVVDRLSAAPLGLVKLYEPSFEHGYSHCGVDGSATA